jgi:hypothetical protein
MRRKSASSLVQIPAFLLLKLRITERQKKADLIRSKFNRSNIRFPNIFVNEPNKERHSKTRRQKPDIPRDNYAGTLATINNAGFFLRDFVVKYFYRIIHYTKI